MSNDKTVITPTIGRRVWYWPSAQDRGETEHKPESIIQQGDLKQACDAGIVYVHGDRMVNLTVADHNGVMHSRTSVLLMQEGDEIPQGMAYAQWMPYQTSQAKKHGEAKTEGLSQDASSQDARMEAEIQAKGLTAPRVTKERIDYLMSKVTYKTRIVEGTTTTIAVAILPVGNTDFTLAIERTACIDKSNFNAELGAKYAIESATESARNKLWELEGYKLACDLAVADAIAAGEMLVVDVSGVEATALTQQELAEVAEAASAHLEHAFEEKDEDGNRVNAEYCKYMEGLISRLLGETPEPTVNEEFNPCNTINS